MAIQRYTLYPASFNGGALTLAQVASQSVQSGKSIMVVRPGGSLDGAANVLSAARPVAQLMSKDLSTILATVSLTAGYYCSSASQLNFQQRTAGGSFTAAASAAHVTQSIAGGFLSIAEISADSESDIGAQCNLEFVALSSDGTNPITDAAGAAINGMPTPAFSSVYFHGPAYLGSTKLEGCVRTRVRPGIAYNARMPDGVVFPMASASSIVARNPVFEFDFLKLDIVASNIGNMIQNVLGSAVHAYFRKGTTAAGGRIADASGAHIKISAAAGSWGADSIQVNESDDAVVTVSVMPTGTISLSTTSTIP